MQDSEPDIIDGVGAETGHVIRTTIGGRNGNSKQVERGSTCRIQILYAYVITIGDLRNVHVLPWMFLWIGRKLVI